MMLRNVSIFFLEERLNGDEAELKYLDNSHWDDTGLYTCTTEKPPIIIKAANNFVKNHSNPAPFHAPTVNISTKMSLGRTKGRV